MQGRNFSAAGDVTGAPVGLRGIASATNANALEGRATASSGGARRLRPDQFRPGHRCLRRGTRQLRRHERRPRHYPFGRHRRQHPNRVRGETRNATTEGYGVYGRSDPGRGVFGYSENGIGMFGESPNGYGVLGVGNFAGLYGSANDTGAIVSGGTQGIYAQGTTGVTARGSAGGRSGDFRSVNGPASTVLLEAGIPLTKPCTQMWLATLLAPGCDRSAAMASG